MPFLSALAAALGTTGFGRVSDDLGPFSTIFNFSGSYTVPSGITEIDYIVVGAGGGGGEGRGGGGGAGGYYEASGISVSAGSVLTIAVGAGGAAGIQGAGGAGSNPAVFGQVGGNTTVSVISVDAHGGGGGGNTTTDNPRARKGGSGAGGCNGGVGGVSTQPSPGLGNAGGSSVSAAPSASGGGGGAIQAGFAGVSPDANAVNCSRGGNGQISEITGVSQYYAGGGGGSCDIPALETAYPSGLPTSPVYNNFATGGLGGGGNGGANRYPGVPADAALPEDGTVNTGGGGGGGKGAGASSAANGGKGGSGIVVIKAPRKNFTQDVYVFEGSSTFTIPAGFRYMDYFVISGGGGGGIVGGGGGGGAGGARLGSNLPVSSGDVLTIGVGAGGAISPALPAHDYNGAGFNGGDSEIRIAPSTSPTGDRYVGSNGGGGGGQGANHPGKGSGKNGGCGGGSGDYSSNGTGRGKAGRQDVAPHGNYTPNSAPSGSLSALPGETLTYSVQGHDGGESPYPGTPANYPFDAPSTQGGSPGYKAGGGGGIGGAGAAGGPHAGGGFAHGGVGYFVDLSGVSKGYGGGGGGGSGTPQAGRSSVGGGGPTVPAPNGNNPNAGVNGAGYPGGLPETGYYGGGNGVTHDYTGAGNTTPDNNGAPNSGGGGGGGANTPSYNGPAPSNQGNAGFGGSGVVIIKLKG